MTYAELVHAQAENCVRATYTYHGASGEEQFRKHFEELVNLAYRPEFARHIKDEELADGMISLLFAFQGSKK